MKLSENALQDKLANVRMNIEKAKIEGKSNLFYEWFLPWHDQQDHINMKEEVLKIIAEDYNVTNFLSESHEEAIMGQNFDIYISWPKGIQLPGDEQYDFI